MSFQSSRDLSGSLWIIKVFTGNSNISFERFGTYDYVANSCAGYPASYIWSIESLDK